MPIFEAPAEELNITFANNDNSTRDANTVSKMNSSSDYHSANY